VLIGRLVAYGLAAGGEAGVRRVIELLAEELRTLMILAGLPDLKSITPDVIARREAR
jgi:4-hydroxymandelate oxidase